MVRDRKVSLKTVTVTSICIAILASALTWYAFGPFTSPNIELDDLPSQAYFTVRNDGTYTWVTRYDGHIAYNGTVASTVINNALGALTVGRDWKETVLLRGDFTVTAGLTPSNWTRLEIDGTVATSTADVSLILIEGTAPGPKYQIDVVASHLIGAGDKGTDTDHNNLVLVNYGSDIDISIGLGENAGFTAIEIGKSTWVHVHDSHLKDFARRTTVTAGKGIALGGSSDCEIYNNWIETPTSGGYSGTPHIGSTIFLYGDTGYPSLRNDIHDNILDGGGTGFDNDNGIYLNAQSSNVSYNNIHHNTISGYNGVGRAGVKINTGNDNNINFNTVINCGITVQSDSSPPGDPDYSTRNQVIGNKLFHGGIGTGGQSNARHSMLNLIADNILSSDTYQEYGIYIGSYSNGTEVHGNIVSGISISLGITAYNSHIVCTENNIPGSVIDNGVDTIWGLNVFEDGKPNINSGMAVNSTTTTWSITHGLAWTPTFVSCSFNSTNIDSWRWTATSTTITVTCVNRVTTDAIVACYWYAEWIP